MRYFEDFPVGEVVTLGPLTVEAEAIVAFAERYDPQRMHIDPEWAEAEGPFGGLIASGWHTGAMTMRLLADWFRAEDVQGVGSPGIKELRWLKPVRPGDELTLTFEVLDAWPSKSKPMGFIDQGIALRNQAGEVVLTSRGLGMFKRRAEAGR